MRSIHSLIGAALVALIAAGCAQPPPAVDLAAEEQAIRDRSAQWLQLAQARDVAGIVNEIYLADAATLFDGQIRKGSAEIQAGIEEELAAVPEGSITWTTDSVTVAASGDLAYERGSFTFDADGAGEAPPTNGEFVTIWRKVDGTWRAAVDAGTAVKVEPAGGTGGADQA